MKFQRAVSLLLFSTILLSGCFTANRTDTSALESNTISNNGSETSQGDGARGQCLNLDKSRPERPVCIDCYNGILAERCPGKSEPSQCLDQTVRNTFTNLVNQCILQTMNSGSNCTKTCNSGLVLDRTTCTCVLPDGGGNIPPIDSGQVNYGPPVVELDWPLTFSNTNNDPDFCAATIQPVNFLVQNRGDTVPQFNQYAVENFTCTSAGATGYVQSVTTPALTGGNVVGKFNIKTSGENELFSGNITVGPLNSGALRAARTGAPAVVNFGNLPAATYMLNFDLVLADNWLGAGLPDSTNAPHGFKVTRIVDGDVVVLNATFSTSPGYAQSFTGEPLEKGIDFEAGDGPAPDAKFRVAVPITHVTEGGALDVRFQATGNFLDTTADEPKWRYENLTLRRSGVQTFQNDVAPSGVWTNSTREFAQPEAITLAEFGEFLGRFTNSDETSFVANQVPAGKYLLSFDFYVLDTWTGEGAGIYSSFPRMAGSVTTAASVTAGLSHTCAQTTGNSVICWGEAGMGQLGNNSTSDSEAPVSTLLAGVPIGVVTSLDAGSNHTCAVSNNAVRCWGNNAYGQLGNGTANTSLVATTVINPLSATAEKVSAGENHSCAIFHHGAGSDSVGCWGRNLSGQLGNNSTVDSTSPEIAIAAGTLVTQIAAGGQHTCALKEGEVYCWGEGGAGQVGDNQNADHATPFKVPGLPAGVIIEISAGGAHSCALYNDGKAYCWGDNSVGQLGSGTTSSSATPLQVAETGIKSISAGDTHTCAVVGDYNVKCWGSNTSGKLGDGTLTNRGAPVQVMGLLARQADAITVSGASAGGSHSCAVLSNNKVQCWGANASKQLAAPNIKNKFIVLYDSPDVDAIAEQSVFTQSFSNTSYTQSYLGTATVLKVDYGYLNTPDSIYRLNLLVDHSCATSAPCNFKVTFKGEGLDATRSWGMDNFGVMRLSDCGITYSFTDTNLLSSRYCLRFNPFSSCGQTPSNPAAVRSCDCWARPSITGLRPYFAPLATGESCP